MTQVQKNISVLMKFFKENGITFMENVTVNKIKMDIFVPDMKIAIHYGDDQRFYNRTKVLYAPFFVREKESEAKTLEKIQNCCIMQMTKIHNQTLRK